MPTKLLTLIFLEKILIVHSNVNLGKHGPSTAQDKPHHGPNFKMLMYEIFSNKKKLIDNFLCAVTIYSNLELKLQNLKCSFKHYFDKIMKLLCKKANDVNSFKNQVVSFLK